MKASRLNQVISVEKSVKQKANTEISSLYKSIQHPTLFEGFTKKYQPKDENGERFPNENKRVELKGFDVLKQVSDTLSDLFNITLQKDTANCSAQADLVLDGVVLMSKVPATYLLFLSKQLTDLHTFVSKMPTLPSTDDWTFDTNSQLHKTDATSTLRTKKVQKALMLVPPTDKHPGQAVQITEDEAVGSWETVKMSGALPEPKKAAFVSRIEKLQRAVKMAREQANEATVQEVNTENLFTWLFTV